MSDGPHIFVTVHEAAKPRGAKDIAGHGWEFLMGYCDKCWIYTEDPDETACPKCGKAIMHMDGLTRVQ